MAPTSCSTSDKWPPVGGWAPSEGATGPQWDGNSGPLSLPPGKGCLRCLPHKALLGTLAPGPTSMRLEPSLALPEVGSTPLQCVLGQIVASLNSGFLRCKMEMIIKAPLRLDGGWRSQGCFLEEVVVLEEGQGASWASASLQMAFSTGQTLAVLDLHPACSKSSRRELLFASKPAKPQEPHQLF